MAKKFGWVHISTGDLLRKRARKGDRLGKEINHIMHQGRLVPHWIQFTLILSQIVQAGPKKNVIIDGSPRSLGEADMVDEGLSQIARNRLCVLYIHISEREAFRRLLKRGRSDDTKSAIKKRILYKKGVLLVVDHYAKKGVLIRINGEQARDQVFNEIIKKLKAKRII